MSDFYVIDFIDVPSKNGGDAIAIQYKIDGQERIHVVDAGYQDTGEKVVDHIKKYYGSAKIDHVVSTHPDNDHAGGLRTILEEFEIGKLWLLRPWLYIDELLPRFTRYRSAENLIDRLKDIYSNIVALEEIAIEKGIPIGSPFEGTKIGAFTVTSPTKDFYLDLVVNSEKTPEAKAEEVLSERTFASIVRRALNLIRKAWGIETFSGEETTSENEMSIVQFANICDNTILLTGDAGRTALTNSISFLKNIGIKLPGISKFQVPHHGSRRNLSSKILDDLIGQRLTVPLPEDQNYGTAMISASKEDDDHPRNATVRALIHRGYAAKITKGVNLYVGFNVPARADYSPAPSLPYPDEEESE